MLIEKTHLKIRFIRLEFFLSPNLHLSKKVFVQLQRKLHAINAAVFPDITNN